MPDDNQSDAAHNSIYSTLSRMGERVAKLEANHEALKGDTEVIRHSIHAINQELQKVVIAEQNCMNSLVNLTNQVNRLVDAAPAIAGAVSTFDGMRADMKALIAVREGKTTLAGFAKVVLPWLIGGAGLLAWGIQHLGLK